MAAVTHLDHTFSTQGSWVNLAGTPTYAEDGGSAVKLDEGESIYYTLTKATIDGQTPDKAFAIYIKLKCSGDSQLRLLLTRPDATWIQAHPAQAPASQAGWPYTRLDQTSWGSGYAGFSFVDRNQDDSKYDDDVRVTLGNITPDGQTALTGTIYIERVIIRGYTAINSAEISDDMEQFADGWPTAGSDTAELKKGSLLGTVSSDFMGYNGGLYKKESWGMFDDFGNDRGLHGEYFTTLRSTYPWGHWRGPGGGSPSLLEHMALGGWSASETDKHAENYSPTYWLATDYGPGNANTVLYHDLTHIFGAIGTVLVDLNIIDADRYQPPYTYYRYPGEHRDLLCTLYASGATNIVVELGNEVYGGGSAGTALMGYNPGSLGRTQLTDSGNADAVKHVDSYIRRAINIAKDLRSYWPTLKFAVPINIDTTADDTHVWDIRIKQALNGTHPLNFDLTPWIDYIVWHNYGTRQHLASSRIEDEWYQADIVARTDAKIDDIYTDFGLPVIISECGPVTHTNAHMRTYGYHLRNVEICMALEGESYIRKHCEGKLSYLSWHGAMGDTMGLDIPNAAPYDPANIKHPRAGRFYSALLRSLTHGDDCYDLDLTGTGASDLTGLWFIDGANDRVMIICTGPDDITLQLPAQLQSKSYEATDPSVKGWFATTASPTYLTGTTTTTVVCKAQSITWINPRSI